VEKIRVWDLPLRLFHWALVVCVLGAYACVKSAGITEGWLSETGLDWMTWHSRFGYAVLTLILFRLIWGLFGPRYAQFRHFIAGPARILTYLRNQSPVIGHNPLGAWSVIAMLAAFGLQAVSGLFASDDILFDGPLSTVNPTLSRIFNSLHHASEWVLISLVILHLCAIVYYTLFRRQPLLRAMITGDQPVTQNHHSNAIEPARDNVAVALKAALILLACAALVFWISQY